MRAAQIPATLGKWVLTLAAAVALLVAAYWIHERGTGERATEGDEAAKALPKFIGGTIKLSKQYAASFGIKEELAREIEWVPKAAVYGRVVANPRATTEVRAAFAGRLRTANGGKWPALASNVKAGDLLGQLEVRVGPQDRLDLQAKLNEARLKHEGARKVVHIQQDRVKRFESVAQSLARSELDAALVALAEATTQVATTEAAVKLYEDALAALDRGVDPKQNTWLLPVTAPADGEITELPGRPDMIVESGTLVAKVVDFKRALVRVDIPLNLLTTAPPKTLKLVVLPPTPPALAGPTNRPEPPEPATTVPSDLVGVAPQVDPALQAAGYLYEVTQAAAPNGLPVHLWRPGLFVKGTLDVNAGKPISAVAVPSGALLYHQGRALVYVALSGERYQRREVTVLGRDGDAWVLGAGVDAEDRVVTEGALALLSEEFRADVDD
jgi:hypothetical protein